MDTKLRNVSRNKATKLIAFILTVILITAAMLQIQYVSYLDMTFESLFVEKYKDSEYFFYKDVDQALNRILYFDLIENKDEIKKLPQNLNYYYYISDGETTFTNAENKDKSFFEQNDKAFYAYENGRWSFGENTNGQWLHSNRFNDEYTIYIAFPDEYMEANQQEWENNKNTIFPFLVLIIVCVVLAFILTIYLMIVTGRKEDGEFYLWRIDKVFTEMQVIALMSIIAIWFSVRFDVLNIYSNIANGLSMDQIYSLVMFGVTTAIMSSLGLVILLSMVRNMKARKLMKQSMIYVAYYKIKDFLKSLFDGRRFKKFPLTRALFYRQLAFIITSAVLVLLTFIFIVVPPLVIIPPIIEMVIIYWYIKYNNRTYEEINKGFDESLEDQMKSEKTKVELITNVSHDLKTPLTSIISYIDLLSKEEDLSETARDYVNILSDKSNRLKNIVSDLFDLAKSTSGDINLDLEELDLKKLIEQTLGDMEGEIEKSGLQIRTKLPDGPVNIMSDGKRLYRVFQNVIDNALKYSLKGTRVYVELEEIDGKAVASIKNIADYEMDFTVEDMLQRFNRGDKSRTTDGSGLGLSIAQSFTNVCGGDFKVDIDGDLFKVIIKFNVEK